MICGVGNDFPFLPLLRAKRTFFFFFFRSSFVLGVGQLFQIALPEQFEGKTYLELFRWLTYRNMLPLGLYRSPSIDNDLPYVFVNCPKATMLREHDRVFVLASTEPTENLK
jgi:hypothetical protein